jgi:hypothetical protein
MSDKPARKPVNQTASGKGIVQVAGDGNIVEVKQTLGQTGTSTNPVELRDRQTMLEYVEKVWIKGFLEKSLHGAAMLDLGIKEDPDALNYPWAIKREATQEILPVGISMLDIYEEIGIGRSLLILGAPGSGKTTMLLDLTRQLIKRAYEDITEPIPIVLNLSSWKGNLSLTDWLVREMNIFYAIPTKVAPKWIKENRMLLLLDGLDEVQEGSRSLCVDAINLFRKENGLTNMAVCSRSEDYAKLGRKLAFDGAIEIQHLTTEQVQEYFKRSGKEMARVRKILAEDSILREMAGTPLFLSIMTLTYRGTDVAKIWVSDNIDEQRKYLFDTYIERMFNRQERSKNEQFTKQDVFHYLPWLARGMIEHNQVPVLIESIQPSWLKERKQIFHYRLLVGLIFGLVFGLLLGLVFGQLLGLVFGLLFGILFGLLFGRSDEIDTVDVLSWNSKKAIIGLPVGMCIGLLSGLGIGLLSRLHIWLPSALFVGLLFGFLFGLLFGLEEKQMELITRPGERLFLSTKNFLFVSLSIGLLFVLLGMLLGMLLGRPFFGLLGGLLFGLIIGLIIGLLVGPLIGLLFGGRTLIQHYTLRFVLCRNNILPWKIIPFLDHCVDLIFLRQVGGGYIFVHRLLMEHFAAMYTGEEE